MVVIGTDAPTTGRWVRLFEGNINVKWLGAYGNGTNSDTSYFTNANTYAVANGYAVLVPEGTYLLSTAPTLTAQIEFEKGAILQWTAFHPTIDPIITDSKQHFSVTASATDYPVFPSGTKTIDGRWFGAVGDGVTDDTIPLQAAFLSASNGGSLQFSDGTFACGESAATAACLTLTNNVEVSGKGPHSILKFLSAKATDYGLLGSASGTDLENVHIHDITIDGNKSGQAGGYGIKLYGRNALIENVVVKNCLNTGISLNQVGDTTGHSAIIHCNVNDSSVGYAVDGLYDGRIWGCNVYGGDITGVKISDCTRIVISENSIHNTGGLGFLESGSDTTYGLNYVSGDVTNSFSVARYIDIGNAMQVQIDGDTTVNNLHVSGDSSVVDLTLSGNLTFTGHLITKKCSTDVTGSKNVILGDDGNIFKITGSEKIHRISTDGWTEGGVATLIFDSSVVMAHDATNDGTFATMSIWAETDYTSAANEIMSLQYLDSTWSQVTQDLRLTNNKYGMSTVASANNLDITSTMNIITGTTDVKFIKTTGFPAGFVSYLYFNAFSPNSVTVHHNESSAPWGYAKIMTSEGSDVALLNSRSPAIIQFDGLKWNLIFSMS